MALILPPSPDAPKKRGRPPKLATSIPAPTDSPPKYHSVLRDAVKEARLAKAAEVSLISFAEQAFPIIEPGLQFRNNWHLRAIAEHLEAVSSGEISNLVINIPPGCMKSILVSVAWPAWEWIRNPELRWMGASYGIELAIRDAQKCRDIITSEWYQRYWPSIQLRAGDDQKTKYSLTSGGWRMATSVGGRATGEHPDRKIVDDPTSASQADSEAERETANRWFTRTLSTRGESRGARTVVVMQRLHENDLTGHILSELHDYEHLCLPMEYESHTKRKTTSIGWEDPRTTEGSPLWPEMFPAESVTKLKRLLGEYGTAGQLQQRPAPAGGGILKVDHFQMWPTKDELPLFEYVVQSYDCAFTERTSGDPTACTVWGAFTHKGVKGVMLLDAWSDYLGYPAMRAKVIAEWHSIYGKRDQKSQKKADVVLVEEKASGQSLLQDLRQAQIPAIPYNPGRADKISRAHICAPILELDVVWIPESKKNPGEFVSWAKQFVLQCEQFPNAEHDDYVDTATQALILLRDQGRFELQQAEPDFEEDDHDYVKNPIHRVNPYAQ
jgi:predicted phage terminase large subunit-like protein